jgi:predicted nuclease with TOPRIM domain
MARDVVELDRGITECSGWLTELEDRKHELAEAVTKIESEIDERTEALKRLIEDKKTRLKKELTAVRGKKLAQIGDVAELITQRRLLMDGLRRYTDELESKGAASDIARQTNALHDSTVELLTFDNIRRHLDELSAECLVFEHPNVLQQNGIVIGKICFRKIEKS